MKVYLVRHGNYSSPEIDPEKGLSPQGRADVERLAKFLAAHGFPLSAILHSGKARAKQTAEIYREFLAPNLQLEKHRQMGPNDPIEGVMDRVEDGVMFVGHLPFMEKLLGQLVAFDQNLVLVKFSAGMVVCLEKEGYHFVIDWAMGT